MYMKDFEFDDVALSSFSCIPCFISNSGDDDIEMVSALSFSTIKNPITSRHKLISASYDDVLETDFDIMKLDCDDTLSYTLTEDDIRKLTKWLNRKTYCKFKPIYSDGSFSDIFFKGSFTEIHLINNSKGLTLHLMTNAPFAYGDDITVNGTETLTIDSDSDEIGNLYPSEFIITCNSSGTIYITNSMDDSDRFTRILNCSSGEVITLDCENKIISTNSTSHDTLYNDFNFVFPRIVTEYNNDTNVYTDTLGSTMSITFNPVRKVGVIL